MVVVVVVSMIVPIMKMLVVVVSVVWALLISVHYLPTVWPTIPCHSAGYSKVTPTQPCSSLSSCISIISLYSPLLLTIRYYRYPIFKHPQSRLLPTTNNLIHLIQLNFLSHCWLSVLFYSLCFSVLWPTPAPPSPCQSTALPAKAVFSPP